MTLSFQPFKPQEKEVAGLVKFFSKPEYMTDLLNGLIYCNTPQYYRDCEMPGVSDDFETCIGYYNPKKHPQKPNITIDRKKFDLSEVSSALIYRDEEKFDAHLQCWAAIEKPTCYNELLSLRDDFQKIMNEFGSNYVFLPAQKIGKYFAILKDAVPKGLISSHVEYTDNPVNRGMFRKCNKFSYQREYRFAFGNIDKEENSPRIIKTQPLQELLFVNPEISISVDNEKLCVLKQTNNAA